MDALLQIGAGFASLLGMIAHGVFASAQPTLDLLIPAALAWVVHRYVKSQAAADVLTDMAGAAYIHMSQQMATGTAMNFTIAKQMAVAAAVKGIDSASVKALSKMSKPELMARVNAKLGTLLASDPNFDVSMGRFGTAATAGLAPAAASALNDASAQTAAAVTTSTTAGPVPLPAGGVNFDLQDLVTEAVRDAVSEAMKSRPAAS